MLPPMRQPAPSPGQPATPLSWRPPAGAWGHLLDASLANGRSAKDEPEAEAIALQADILFGAAAGVVVAWAGGPSMPGRAAGESLPDDGGCSEIWQPPTECADRAHAIARVHDVRLPVGSESGVLTLGPNGCSVRGLPLALRGMAGLPAREHVVLTGPTPLTLTLALGGLRPESGVAARVATVAILMYADNAEELALAQAARLPLELQAVVAEHLLRRGLHRIPGALVESRPTLGALLSRDALIEMCAAPLAACRHAAAEAVAHAQ